MVDTWLLDKPEGPIVFSLILPVHCAPDHTALCLDTLRENTIYRHKLMVCADKTTPEVLGVLERRGINPYILDFGEVYHVYDWGAANAPTDWLCWMCDDTVHGPGWDKRVIELIEDENSYPGLFTMQPPQTGGWSCALHSVDLGLEPRHFSREAFAEETARHAQPIVHRSPAEGVSVGPPHICHKHKWEAAGGFLKNGGAFPSPLDLDFVNRCIGLGAVKRSAGDVFVYHFGDTTGRVKRGQIQDPAGEPI